MRAYIFFSPHLLLLPTKNIVAAVSVHSLPKKSVYTVNMETTRPRYPSHMSLEDISALNNVFPHRSTLLISSVQELIRDNQG